MGKKKGNKTETNGEVDIDEIEDESPESVPAAGKKGKKSKKKKDNFDDDDIAKELEELRLEESGEKKQVEEKDEEPVTEKKNKKEKKKSKKKAESSDESEEETASIKPKMGGGFAALMMDDDDDDDEMAEESEEEQVVVAVKKPKKDKKKKEKKLDESEDEGTPTPPPVAAPTEEEKGGKKGKKGKKKKKDQDDDEDIDALLAEIEAEHRGEKPKPKDEPKEEKTDDSEKKPEEAPPPAEEESKKKKKKKKGQSEAVSEQVSEPALADTKKDIAQEGDEEKADDAAEESSSKKKKKKKKGKETTAAESKEGTPAPEGKEGTPDNKDGDDNEDESSGKKKKKKGEKEEKKKKGAPGNKLLAAMKEELARQEAEREKLRLEEEEAERKEEERIRAAEEAKKLEEERKERKKQKEKERKERLRAEGKLLTKAQKQAQQRAQEMLEHLRAQGVDLPGEGDKRPRPGTRVRPGKKNKKDQQQEEKPEEKPELEEKMEVETVNKVEEVKEEEEDEVKDAWDASSEEEEEEEEKPEVKKELKGGKKQVEEEDEDDDEEEEEDDDDDEEEDDSEEESSEEEESDDDMTEAERRKAKAQARIEKRKIENEKNRDPDNLRAPVVCVLGHVDHGKTKILDKLRRTNVQDGEVGGITQQIGATNVPMEAITSQTRHVKDFNMKELKFPGLLIIDTPGHESFSNLRTRGSSMCDIAILVVDITQGLEPQTIESINLLKKRKTPFIVALNKVDRVFEWESYPTKDIRETITTQNESSKNDFTRRTSEIILALNQEGLNAALFWENPDPRSYVSLVPTSAISGDGMGNLVAMIAQMCQKRLYQRLMFTEQLQCIVLEVKTIVGHGVTIDVILINGRLRAGDTIVLAGTDGPIVTQIRSLLLPQPMKEIRVKGQYSEFKEVSAATGLKIAAKEFEKAIAGLELLVAHHEDEVEIYREIADRDFKAAMRSIKVKDHGVYVQASTLGALEALLEFFKVNKVPYSGVRVGPVVKRDVMKAAAMLEHDPMYAAILAFDVKVERDAQELADKEGVKIFSEETIYHLGDRYVDYIKEYKKKKQDEFKNIAVFPSRCKIIPTAIFNKRDPIVLGVTVDTGILRTGTPLCVPAKEFVEIGIVTSLEYDHKPVDLAKKGVDVCIKIEPMPGHTPKLFGRHFDETDILVSKISRESINACKDYFRDDLGKGEWKLMAELKKEFQIL